VSATRSPLPVTRDNLRRGGLAAWVAFLLFWLGGLIVSTAAGSIADAMNGTVGTSGGQFVLFALLGTIPAAFVGGVLTAGLGVPLSALIGWLLRDVPHPAPHIAAEALAGVLVTALPLGLWSLTVLTNAGMFWSSPLIAALLAAGGAASAAGWIWAWRHQGADA
jgi:hypothetical protein